VPAPISQPVPLVFSAWRLVIDPFSERRPAGAHRLVKV